MRRTIPLVLVALVLAMVEAPPTAAANEEPTLVFSSRYPDLWPAASSDHVAWTTIRPKDIPLWVQPTEDERFRANPKGTWGVMAEIDGTLLAYAEVDVTGGTYTSDIRFLDLETREFLEPPEGLNTDQDEWWPRIDGDLLLFKRENPETSYEELLLLDMTTGESQVLANSSGWGRFFHGAGMAGGLAVWTKYSIAHKGTGKYVSCDVYVHDLATGVTTKLDNPGPRCQFAGTVDAGGTVYYGRGGFACGHHSHLLAVVPGEEPSVLVSLERGRDFASTYARDNADDSTTVYYDAGTCDPENEDIWSIGV
jgi:hypothetical protein